MKKTRKVNYRVEVTPKGLGNYGFASISDWAIEPDDDKRNARYLSICESIISDIRRHVARVQDIEVVHDEESFCEHCGGQWTEDSATYNGGCCEDDESNNPKSREAA